MPDLTSLFKIEIKPCWKMIEIFVIFGLILYWNTLTSNDSECISGYARHLMIMTRLLQNRQLNLIE